MSWCAFVNCSNNTKKCKNLDISFHLIPKEEHLKREWIDRIQRDGNLPKRIYLCSEHFSEECFDASSKLQMQMMGYKKKRILKPGSIPTIFPHALGRLRESEGIAKYERMTRINQWASLSKRGSAMDGVKEKEPDLMVLSGDDEDESEGEEEEEEEERVSGGVAVEEEEGTSERAPGMDAVHPIESTLLAPFLEGWKRECVLRTWSEDCDVYYIPPKREGGSREAHRKKRSKRDITRYFDEFPSSSLSVINFSYVCRPLGLNNSIYEIVRSPRDGLRTQPKSVVHYSDSKPATLSSDEDDDDDILEEFSMETSIVLQIKRSIIGMKAEHKKRRKTRTVERCQTPFMAHEAKWTNLDDDPMGIFTSLGGESRPPTPPSLRAVKLTPCETAKKITDALKKVKLEADKLSLEREQDMKDNLASHDSAIRKCKNHPIEKKYSGFNFMNLQQPRTKKSAVDFSPKNNLPCTLHCPGSYGLLPNLTCVSCQCLFHARCQGMTQINRLIKSFKCRACSLISNRNSNPLASSSHSSPSPSTTVRSITVGQVNSIVNVKLPMTTPNGRRPIVELVMHQNGKYQPIKFSNNMQVCEMISRTIFDRATTLQRTLYQKARKVPRVNGRPIFLAINPTTPSNRGQLNALFCSAQLSRPNSVVSSSPSESNKNDQVSILVRSQSSPKPVLLNVPRKIAIKVKVGTTLSFSASSDQKYTVIDSKIHPPVNSSSRRSATSTTTNSAPVPKRRAPDLTVYRGITISRITDKRPPQPTRRIPPPHPPEPSRKVSSDLEINPCTPYCPGVTGFPEVECKGCQSLFHAQCVGLLSSRSLSNFYCKMCSRTRTSNPRSTPQVINLD